MRRPEIALKILGSNKGSVITIISKRHFNPFLIVLAIINCYINWDTHADDVPLKARLVLL